MSKILITGVRKGKAPKGEMEYDVRIGDAVEEKMVVAKSEAEAVKKAKKGQFLDIEKVYGKAKKKRRR